MTFMRWCGKIVYKQTGHMTMWRMHIAGWMPKATNTHSEYVICIVFPPPYCYMYSACIVFTFFSFKWKICHSVNFMSFTLAILDFFLFFGQVITESFSITTVMVNASFYMTQRHEGEWRCNSKY